MKKWILIAAMLLVFGSAFGQNAITGSGFTAGWNPPNTDNSDISFFSASEGNSRIGTLQANGTGDQYFRLVKAWDFDNSTQYGPSGFSDTEITIGSEVTGFESPTGSGAWYTNVTSTDHNYVFKTRTAGNPPNPFGFVVFKVEGDVRTIASVARSPLAPSADEAVTITATLDDVLNTGQGVYLRYSNDNFSTSTVVEMTISSGSSYTANIPAGVNIASANIDYTVFTSGAVLTISASDVDFLTINKNDNSGAGYEYTIGASITTAQAGNWSSTSTWTAGEVPAAGEVVNILHDVTLDQDATVEELNIDSGATFTASDGSTRTLTISTGGSIGNSGTFTAADGTVAFSGSGSVSTATTFNNVSVAGGVALGSSSTINGKLTIESGGYLAQTAGGTGLASAASVPNFGASSTLRFNGTFAFGGENYAGGWGTTTGRIPTNVEVGPSGELTVTTNARSLTGTLSVEAGGTLTTNNLITIKSSGMLYNLGTVTGNISFDRDIEGNAGWRMLSSPISGFTVSQISDETAIQGVTGGDFATATSNFYYYPSTGTWTVPSDVSTAVPDGNGFITYFYNNTDNGSTLLPITLVVNGSEPTSNVTVNAFSDSVSSFTLLGNPFGSNLNLSSLTHTGGTGLQTNAQIWSDQSESYQPVPLASTIVPPFQGFWVESADASLESVTIPTSGRTNSAANANYFDKEVKSPELVFALKSESRLDKSAIIQLHPNASTSWDKYDASKLVPLVNSYASIGFVGPRGDGMAIKTIESLPTDLDEAITIPIQLSSANFDGELELSWEGIDTFPAEWTIELFDAVGNQYDLRTDENVTFSWKSDPTKAQLFSATSPTMKAQSAAGDFTLVITPNRTTSNEGNSLIPNKVELAQNFPNPFNPSTQIRFALPATMLVSVAVYDMNGRMVDQLAAGTLTAGQHSVTWNAGQQASGLYLLKLTAGNQTITRKMTLIK